jgi:hypothetical protein
MAENLIDGLQKELNRAREILTMYEEIPHGAFGAVFLRQSIQRAEKSNFKW